MTVPVTSIRKSGLSDAPAKQATFEGVQILRGVAAAMVVFHHMCWVITSYHPQRSTIASFYRLAEFGAGGVDIFFCISGLVIAHAARNLSPGIRSAGTFAWRRLLRVLPPYWVFTLALVALWAVGFALRSLVMTPGLFISSMLLIPWPKYSGDGVAHYRPILDVGWTLSFEMFFYALCAGVIAVGGGRRIWPWAPLLLALVAGSAFAFGATPSVVDFSLASPMLAEFVFGVFIARYVAGRIMPRLGWFLVAVGMVGLTASIFVSDPINARVLCWGIPGAVLVAGLVVLPISIKGPATRAGAFFGVASYTIYLAHPFFTLVAGTVLKKGAGASLSPDFLLLTLTVIAIGGSASAWFVVEKPLVRFLKPRSRTAALAREIAGSS